MIFKLFKNEKSSASRVSNASGFFLRAIASPVNSWQFSSILHNCAQFENSCVQRNSDLKPYLQCMKIRCEV